MQIFTGPSCQEVSAVYLAVDAAYRPRKEYVNWSLDGPGVPPDLRAVSGGWVVQGGHQRRRIEF